MGNVVQNVTSTTTADELQERNGQDHQRVFDPSAVDLLQQILSEMKDINFHLQILTEEKP